MKTFALFVGALLLSMSFAMAEDGHDHGHGHGDVKPSHGGEILEVGEHVAHIEYVHDEKQGKVILHILDKEGKPMGIGDAPRLNLTYKVNKETKRKQLITKAIDLKDGTSHEFETEDSILKSEDFEGKISVKINKKTYQVEIHNHSEHEGHDHGDHEGHDH